MSIQRLSIIRDVIVPIDEGHSVKTYYIINNTTISKVTITVFVHVIRCVGIL